MNTGVVQKIRERLPEETLTMFLIVACFLVIALVRITFGVVPWYLLFVTVPMLVLAFLRPKAGIFAIVILTILFERFFTLEGFQFGRDVIKLYPLDIVLLGVYASVCVKMLFGKVRQAWSGADMFFGAFFVLTTLYLMASAIGFGDQAVSVAFSTWKNYVFYGALVFVLPIVLPQEQDVREFLGMFFTAAVLGIVFLLIGIVRGEGLWTEFTPLSTEGVRILAFPHAFYFSLAFLGLLVVAGQWITHRYRPILWGVMVLWALGILGSLMRHLWIGMAVAGAGAFVLFMERRSRQAVRTLGIIFLASLTAVLAGFLLISLLVPFSTFGETAQSLGSVVVERVVSIGSTTDESISWRGSTWQSAFTKLSVNPVFGTGLGLHIPVESGDYRDFVEIRNIHNSWLALLVQMGVLGFVLLGIAVAILAWRVYRLKSETPFIVALRSILLTLVVYQSIVLLAQPYLETNLMGIFFWMTLGLMRWMVEFSKQTHLPSPSSSLVSTRSLTPDAQEVSEHFV